MYGVTTQKTEFLKTDYTENLSFLCHNERIMNVSQEVNQCLDNMYSLTDNYASPYADVHSLFIRNYTCHNRTYIRFAAQVINYP